jgi:hypothetical protein
MLILNILWDSVPSHGKITAKMAMLLGNKFLQPVSDYEECRLLGFGAKSVAT